MAKTILTITFILIIGSSQFLLKAQITKTQILNKIVSLKDSSTVLSGQHCGDGNNITTFYETMMTGLYNLTGKYAVIVGADYGFKANNNLELINTRLIEHWEAGGLVTISWHADNPYVEGYNCRWNSVTNNATINFNNLLKSAPNSTVKTNYRTELEKVAVGLQELKNAGVIVIWRPFHEMNGNWFWWGINEYNNKQTNVQAFISLWKDMYDTFVNDYGLTNLIWVYSPNVHFSWSGSVTAYYPGSSYVDLVGEDVYSAEGGLPDYEELSTFGKPIVLGECGPNSEARGKYDEVAMVNNIAGKACYFLQWHSWPGAAVAIKDNLNAIEMMNSEKVITLDEIDFSTATSNSIEVKKQDDVWKVFPNPAKQLINVAQVSYNYHGLSEISLFNTYGSLIKKESFFGQEYQLNVSDLVNGTYVLKLKTTNGKMTSQIVKY